MTRSSMRSSRSISRGISYSESIVRHGRQSTTGPIVAALKLLGAVLAVVLISAVSIAAVAVYGTVSQIKPGIHIEHLAGAAKLPPPGIGATDGEVNILVVGTDTRTGQSG